MDLSSDTIQWNAMEANVIASLAGNISGGMQMILLSRRGRVWVIEVILDSIDEDDRDAIRDISDGLEGMLGEANSWRLVETLVTTDVRVPPPPVRLLFHRRKVWCE